MGINVFARIWRLDASGCALPYRSCVNSATLTQQPHLAYAVPAPARMSSKNQGHTRLSAPDCTLNELAKSSDFTWLVMRWYISDAISRTLGFCKTITRMYVLKLGFANFADAYSKATSAGGMEILDSLAALVPGVHSRH